MKIMKVILKNSSLTFCGVDFSEILLTDLEHHANIVAANGVWTNVGNDTFSIMVKVQAGKTYRLKNNAVHSSDYSVHTSYSTASGTNNVSPTFYTNSGNRWRISPEDGSVVDITIPSDGEYLSLRIYKEDGQNLYPTLTLLS